MTKAISIYEVKLLLVAEHPHVVSPVHGSTQEANDWCKNAFGPRRFSEWSSMLYLDSDGTWDICGAFYFLKKEDAALFKLRWG